MDPTTPETSTAMEKAIAKTGRTFFDEGEGFVRTVPTIRRPKRPRYAGIGTVEYRATLPNTPNATRAKETEMADSRL
jgi:hypothetical protein